MRIKWTRTAFGWTAHDGLSRWTVRGPIMGNKSMFWLYRDGHRVTTTGRYDDAVSFKTAREAKKRASQSPRPEVKVEWAHQIGSKTMLSHAYKAGCEPNAMPICGFGTIWRCTTLSATSKGRKYRLVRCGACEKIVGVA